MKDLNITKIYCNGCSHSAGGGLELDRLLDEEIVVRDYYKQKYNVEWETQVETTYVNYISKNLGCEYVNEAGSGGGSERVVRMTYDFIKKNWKIKENLLLILEFPSLGRLDLYSNKLKDYIIANLHFSNNDYYDDSITSLFGTRGYFNRDFLQDNAKIVSELTSYYRAFFSKRNQLTKVGREINMLLTYLKYHNIKFIFFTGEFSSLIDSEHKRNNLLQLKVGNIIIEDLHEFALKTNSTIAEECDLLTTDLHPGYFCHQNFGNLLSDYIIENYDKL